MLRTATRLVSRRTVSRLFQHKQRYFLQIHQHNLKYLKSSCSIFNKNSFSSYSNDTNRYNYANTSDNNISERTVAALTLAYSQGRIYWSNFLRTLETLEFEKLQEEQKLLLLQCCGEALVDVPFHKRTEICSTIWKNIEDSAAELTVNYYNTYLQTCLENRQNVDLGFLTKMKCSPNLETYRLLLDCACEVGDVAQAIKTVAVMKSDGFPIDERAFNALVLVNAAKGGLADAEKVLVTMQRADVPVSSATFFAIARGLAWRSDKDEFVKALRNLAGRFNEQQLLKLLTDLGLKGNHLWLEQILTVMGPLKLSKGMVVHLESACVHLIHSGQIEAAFYFYQNFVQPLPTDDEDDYAFVLLEQLLHCSANVETILKISDQLKNEGLNAYVLQRLTWYSLKRGHTEKALELMKLLPGLRTHYFWPILLQTFKKQGETGVLAILKLMLEKDVRPDLDTLQYYVIPFCDSVDAHLLLLRLHNLGFSIRELITPFLASLIKEKRIGAALQLCKFHEHVQIQSERILQPLARFWKQLDAVEDTLKVLQRLCSTSALQADYAGQFLIRCIKMCRSYTDYEQYLRLLEEMKNNKIHISFASADALSYRLTNADKSSDVKSQIHETVNNLVDASLNRFQNYIPHPRDMSLTELENHLIELQSKGMEMRGTLRRLINEHARFGNNQRANELRHRFIALGYEETAGMKAILIQLYFNGGRVDEAVALYFELKKSHPDFILDEFKIVDLATALVARGDFALAVEIISKETEKRKVKGGPKLIRNCWKLILTGKDAQQTNILFDLLVERGYCIPSNVILGPLVKVHLNEGNVRKAVETYRTCAEKYSCTPLQLELLCAAIDSENEQLLQEVLNVTSKIHGSEAATMTMIAGLAQKGLHKSLRKVLKEAQFFPRDLDRRCNRWVTENKASALETLAEAAYKLPGSLVNLPYVYLCIMKVHSVNSDCEAALAFYESLLVKGEKLPQKLLDDLLRLVNRCKYKLPDSLARRDGEVQEQITR